MGRSVEVEFCGYDYDVSVDGAGSRDGLASDAAAEQGWEAHFAHYREDAQGRLVYFWQPATSSLGGVRNDIAWMRAHPRPHFDEVFDRAEIRREWPIGKTHPIKTLSHVTLLEALEGLVEVLKERDAASGERGA